MPRDGESDCAKLSTDLRKAVENAVDKGQILLKLVDLFPNNSTVIVGSVVVL